MVRLAHNNAEASAFEAIRDPHLPERPVMGQRRGHHLVGQLGQVAVGRSADVSVDVELVVVDPYRPVQPEWHVREPLVVTGGPPEPAGDVVAQLLEARWRTLLPSLWTGALPKVARSLS